MGGVGGGLGDGAAVLANSQRYEHQQDCGYPEERVADQGTKGSTILGGELVADHQRPDRVRKNADGLVAGEALKP